MAAQDVDYIIVGGGLTGCTIASRLKQCKQFSRIVLIEAGPNASDDTRTHTAMGAMTLGDSEYDWAYKTTPQTHLKDSIHTNAQGKVLGGGSTTNYGGWLRGDASDYDAWGKIVQDKRWSYSGLLPYLRKPERHSNASLSPQHGINGPMHVVSVTSSDPDRIYPLRDAVREAWKEIGVEDNHHAIHGNVGGISEFEENWRDGQRQPSHQAYPLKGVQILTNTMVQRVILSQQSSDDNTGKVITATGVELVNGTIIRAKEDVILTAGAYRTPQLLMLSGIGPKDELETHNITPVSLNEHVGINLFDHFASFQYWRLLYPLALGSPALKHPAFAKGLPQDWVIRERFEDPGELTDSALLHPARQHIETIVVYAPAAARHAGVDAPLDGYHIATSTMLLLPTSRGTITLSSAAITDPPIIDPNYYSTAADKAILIHGVERTRQALLGTKAGKSFVEREVPPPNFSPLTTETSSDLIDERIQATGVSHSHAAGTAAMGKVVDTELRVVGVKGLRVADASVLPVAIGGHPQTTLYALAEQAAEMIVGRRI
ncbi:uncharacterized protein KY384_004617 [Bacidia gigantensis]|uniref:uncharacterized protein n=1 Tax=Bacidia gigantensis TaxID=2732470 RepID=UPI001D053AEC|nr:uncharacterized protein KY384_004617 [Bacidia gigantensis]KAG8531259.1 hypothetical protein KY384_004617 [Bacidia gigantensis]